MGGRGSGQYYHWSNAVTVEETKRIDIRFMRRNRMLSPGSVGSLYWNCAGEPAGDIRYVCYLDRLVLKYRYRYNGGDWEPVEQTIFFDCTYCHLGGERLWFHCPYCGRRCEVLCLAGKFAACRVCYRLPYRSQCEGPLDRLIRRQYKLEAMLWGKNRKWYRRAKRDRLMTEWLRITEAVDCEFIGAYATMLGVDEKSLEENVI